MIREIIKPDYYDKFVCIAEQCPFTCCQEWKIAVDDDTNRKWKKLPPPGQTRPRYENCSAYTAEKDTGRVIQLNGHHQCPFLDEKQLCRIVLSYGDEWLSETCRIFPREIHNFTGRTEYSLMTCCPVVVDFLNERKEVKFFVKQEKAKSCGRTEREKKVMCDEKPQEGSKACGRTTEEEEALAYEEILRQIRKLCIEILRNENRSIERNFLIIFYIMLDFMDHEDKLSDKLDFWLQRENIEKLAREMEKIKLNQILTFKERNELFLDISINYRQEKMYQKCLNLKIEAAEEYEKQQNDTIILRLLRQYEKFELEKENEKLYRNFIIQEVYADLLIPGGDLEEMLVKMQWIAMEYAVMRHMNFLDWTEKGKNLEYEDIRQNIVVICRMMGYEEEDIFEYLEDEFENLHWEWGYFALMMGSGCD